jgi:hypothetical protein
MLLVARVQKSISIVAYALNNQTICAIIQIGASREAVVCSYKSIGVTQRLVKLFWNLKNACVCIVSVDLLE